MTAETTAGFARCPHHLYTGIGRNGGLTGLVLDGGQLVFRDHTKKVGRVTVPCSGSGQPYEPKEPS